MLTGRLGGLRKTGSSSAVPDSSNKESREDQLARSASSSYLAAEVGFSFKMCRECFLIMLIVKHFWMGIS